MIKISVSFNKKIPGEEQYSSLCFHTAMERELSDGLSGSDIQAEIHRSYQLLEKTVEAEITSYKQRPQLSAPNVPVATQNQAQIPAQTTSVGNPLGPGSGAISQKQISLICSLASQLKISQHQLCDESLRHFGKASYHELDKKQGSAFIDMLQQRKQPA